MSSPPWLLRLAGRHLVPLLLLVFALLTIGWRYQQQMGAIVTDVAQQETERLRERLSIDQNRLDVRMGLNDALFLRRLVGTLALHEGLSHAYLIDPGGRVEASLSRLDLQRPFTEVLTRAGVPPALAGLQAAVLPRAIEVTPQGAGLALSGAVPLQGGHRLLVWVDNAHAVAVRRAAVQTELLRESVLVLVAVAALALLLHLLWFRRAQRLAGALGAMGAGDLSARTGLQGRDELALIGEAADRMAGQLHQEQERLRHMNDLINRSPAVVIEWLNQPGWPVVQVSESVRHWGYEPEQLLQGRVHYSDLIHPDDRLRIHAEVAEHFAQGPDEYRQTYRIRCADGRWAWVDDRTTLSRDGAGQVVGISGVLLDVSAQRDAEQAQQEQAELLRMFYELPFLGMAISSPTDKCWLQVNDRLCEILGYSRDELLSMSWAEMTPPGDLERNVVLFDELIAGLRNGYRMAKRFVRKDGRIVHAEIDVRAVRDAAGSVRRLFATIQDVTERQAAEAALQRSQEQLEEAQRIGRMGSWDYDLRTGVVAWSDETFRIQEIDPAAESASFEVFLDLIHPDDRARVAETYQRSVEQHTPYETRYRIVTRSGRTRYLHVRGETQYEQGQPVRSIGMVRDETELVEAQRERDRLASVLETTADIVSMADPQGRVFYFNRAGYDMMGLSADTPLDDVIQRVHPPWAAQLVHHEGIPTAIREGRWLGETAVFDAQGREVPMSQLIMAHRGADGQVDYLWTILRDVSGSKAAEAALDRERAQLADAQAVAHVGSWIVQMPGGELTWSDEHYRVLGFEPRSVTPSLETFLSVVHPDDRPRVLAQVEHDMQRRTPGFSRTEHRVVTPNGIRHVEERANVEIDEQGEVFRIIGTTMDITERVQAGEALRRSEQRYTLAAQIGRSGAWEIWPEEGRVYYDENLSRLLGYAASELSESLADWVDTVPEDARPRVQAAMQAVIEGRSDRYALEHPVRRKDGSIGWVSVNGQRVSAPGEKPMRMVGSSSDITERVLAEQALREAKDMLEQGEAVGHLGSFAYDSHTGELRWSRQAFATIGLPWAPRPPSIDAYCACIHPDDAPGVRASIDLLVAGAEVPEVRFRTHPERGPVRWLRRVYQRIDRSAEGLGPRYIGTQQDITDIRKAEEKLRQVNRELEHRVTERTAQLRQANQELEAFSYTVSHDLKAPLRGIDGYSQLLMEEYGPKLDEDGRQFVQRVRHGVQLMGDLINDLLEYSRMERRDMTRDPVALVPLVQQVLDGYEADIRRLGVQVQTELEPFTLELDREGIAVVLRNLIGNALKFSRDRQPPQVDICSRSEAGRRILWVRDNGVGFDMKYHDRMFGIFQRLHRVEEFPGTGVGLALVFKAVQRMGGRVWAESSPGAGATFFLEFPE